MRITPATPGTSLRYTGHPFLDVGVAAITAHAGKKVPAELTPTDLARTADYIEAHYSKNPMKSLLTSIYTNAGFTQPAFEKRPARRAAYASRVLRGWQPGRARLGPACVFFGTPAVEFANAQMMPLSAATFHPGGIEALPVSGEALLALQAFPLGCLWCGGRVLLLHSDNAAATHAWAAHALHLTMRALEKAEHAPHPHRALPTTRHPRTRAAALLAAEGMAQHNNLPFSMSAYHFSNNRRHPALTIYTLPRQITAFLRDASRSSHRAIWEGLVERAWVREAASAGRAHFPDDDVPGLSLQRNALYEELFNLPRAAARFLRAWLLPLPTNPHALPASHLATALSLVSWPLTQLFLERVVNMEREEIEHIRAAADRVADHIRQEDDEPLFRLFLCGQRGARSAHSVQRRLVWASHCAAQLPFTLDEWGVLLLGGRYGSGSEPQQHSRGMTRDLLLLRIIERLHASDWIMPRHHALLSTDDEQRNSSDV